MKPRRRLGTAAVLLRGDGRFLMQRRGRGCGRDYWSVPGGRQDPGEKLRATIRREVREEVGVRIITAAHVLTVDQECPVCGDLWQTHWYLSTRFVGYPVKSEEVTGLFWATWDDLREPMWPAFAESVPLVRDAVGQLTERRT